jgi:hypothetical protein
MGHLEHTNKMKENPMQYKLTITIKGNITRPGYDGTLTVWVKKGESLTEAAARTLRQTSFPEGMRPQDIVIHESVRVN